MPVVTPVRTDLPSIRNSLASVSASCSASSIPTTGCLPSMINPNSSPESRATTPPRADALRRRATSISNLSPVAWPNTSLISFRPSRSTRQHRELLVGASAGFDHLRQRLQECRAIRQIGQAVVIRHMGHPRLGLAAVGDVLMGLDQILRLACVIEHGHAACQEQPQPVLGADRVLLGEQAALPDRRLVARNDQLGFFRIENVGSRQSGGFLAAPVEDGLGTAVGEKVSPVADALDGQRDRNVVDDQFEKLLGIFQLMGKRPVFGDVVEQRDQEFRLVLLVAGDDAVGGQDAASANRVRPRIRCGAAPRANSSAARSAASMLAAVCGRKISSARFPTMRSREKREKRSKARLANI